MCIDKFANYDQ